MANSVYNQVDISLRYVSIGNVNFALKKNKQKPTVYFFQ